jgi:hypothetical protein
MILLLEGFVKANTVHCCMKIVPVEYSKTILVHHADNLRLIVVVFKIVESIVYLISALQRERGII